MQKRKLYSVMPLIVVIVGLAMALFADDLLRLSGIALAFAGSAVMALMLYDAARSSVPAAPQPHVMPAHHIQRVDELEGLYRTLQSNYFRKTTELQDKIDDLERFHRLSIGRELRLIELINDNERLQQSQNQPADSAEAESGPAA